MGVCVCLVINYIQEDSQVDPFFRVSERLEGDRRSHLDFIDSRWDVASRGESMSSVLSSYSTPQVQYITDDKEKKVFWLLGNDHNFHKGKVEDEVIEFMF